MKLNKKQMKSLVTALAIFVGAALIVPLIPVTESSPQSLVKFVDFFNTIQTHLGTYWMFYLVILALIQFMPKKVGRKSALNKKQIQYIFGSVVILILASLFVPIIGAGDGASTWWVNTVDFFTSSGTHLQTYWMFYTVILAILWFRPKK